ncbi:DNA helicase PIF1, ATP-dependent [Corchorus olitorius]|uniref:ATP-dependent DNA helicase n=1 Tax=Corchorus olitorius TaxID=93759 RepID=A0A1R3GGU3_9ROSI|nr:DNA helicase PIF1, ATP-dependent [Corchorus olitorius]
MDLLSGVSLNSACFVDELLYDVPIDMELKMEGQCAVVSGVGLVVAEFASPLSDYFAYMSVFAGPILQADSSQELHRQADDNCGVGDVEMFDVLVKVGNLDMDRVQSTREVPSAGPVSIQPKPMKQRQRKFVSKRIRKSQCSSSFDRGLSSADCGINVAESSSPHTVGSVNGLSDQRSFLHHSQPSPRVPMDDDVETEQADRSSVCPSDKLLDNDGSSPHQFALHLTVEHPRKITDSHYFGRPDVVCHFCGAMMWMEERPTPPFLDSLLDPNGGPTSRLLRNNIRVYNSLFQFTSLGGKVDNSVNGHSGPFIFRLNNQTYHQIAHLLPSEDYRPQFAQMYIYDCSDEVSYRNDSVVGVRSSDCVNHLIVGGLMVMLDDINPIVKLLRSAKERIALDGSKEVRIRLVRGRGSDPRTYAAPTCDQVGGLNVGDFGRSNGDGDVVVQYKESGLQHISTVHSLYMALQYPLLFPYGEDGFVPNLNYIASPVKDPNARKTISMRDYYSYQLQQRASNGETLLRGGRLFQQFCVDAFSAVQEGELHWLDNHQKEIMADMYTNVKDLMRRCDVDASGAGKRIVLPASFTGGPRYLYQKYQDAMAICRAYGYPDLFITFTCNGNWPELKEAMEFLLGLRPEDRPDLVTRMFHVKLQSLIDDLMKKSFFGPALAAKLPDKELDPIGYEAVTAFMMHGPCWVTNPTAPSMEKKRCEVVDEIRAYLDCRYLCAYEACWCMFSFKIHLRQPAVLRLLYESTRSLLYADFPSHFVWHSSEKTWEPRQKCRSIGRVIQINVLAGELYYLRLLLNVVRGPRSYEEIRTVNGILYPRYQAACEACGLIGDDREWHDAIVESSHAAFAYEIRELYCMLVIFCQVIFCLKLYDVFFSPFFLLLFLIVRDFLVLKMGFALLMTGQISDPTSLFDAHWKIMSDDIEYRFKELRGDPTYVMPDADLRDHVLLSVDDILHRFGSSFADKNIPTPQSDLHQPNCDRLILEEMNYEHANLDSEHTSLVCCLNPQQLAVYDAVLESIECGMGKMFFVHGHGGTGKTFLWKP